MYTLVAARIQFTMATTILAYISPEPIKATVSSALPIEEQKREDYNNKNIYCEKQTL